MCLHVVTNRALNRSGTGYKVFRLVLDGNLASEIMGGEILKPGKWLQSSRTLILNSYVCYDSGWHIFKRLRDAKDWMEDEDEICVIRKVEYRKGHTLGTQSIYDHPVPVIVAHEMRILE